VVGGVAAGAERGPDRLRGIGSPFGDRGHRAGAGKHCGGGHRQDGDEWVAAARSGSRVGDGSQVGEQVRGFAVVEGLGVGQLRQGGRDRR
jgi:hypothetical protein